MKGQHAMRLPVVEGDRLLQVGVCRSRLPEEQEASSQRKLGLQQAGGIVQPVGQAEALLRQLARRLVLRLREIKSPQAKQHRKELWRLTHVPAQLSGARVGLPDFRGALPL